MVSAAPAEAQDIAGVKKYQVAIVGAGPAGLSAAVTAARLGVDYILLEKTDHLADTIFQYQAKKAVMAQPTRLPHRGTLPFAEGTREDVLGRWQQTKLARGLNVRVNAEVDRISGRSGDFSIHLKSGDTVTARTVLLTAGQCEPRRLRAEGANQTWVQYQLIDPEEYRNEKIIIIGAGDAGIENAIALKSQNQVTIINDKPNFLHAMPGNAANIDRAIRAKQIRACFTERASVMRLESEPKSLSIVDRHEGAVTIPCDRIIVRIGSVIPWTLLQKCGITNPDPSSPDSLPEISDEFESRDVPGLYLAGTLAGTRLIKQAINQGREAIRSMIGRPIRPSDQRPLRKRFAAVYPDKTVDQVLGEIRGKVPLLAMPTEMFLREALLDSNLVRVAARSEVFHRDDYSNSLWIVVEGAVEIVIGQPGSTAIIALTAGEFFGELGLLSGRRRTATVRTIEDSILIEIPRAWGLRLQGRVRTVKDELERVAKRRLVHLTLAPNRPIALLDPLISASKLETYDAFQEIFKQGSKVDALYIMRRGSATVSIGEGKNKDIVNYIAAGTIFGERGFLDRHKTGEPTRAATVTTTIASEVIRIEAGAVLWALDNVPGLNDLFEEAVRLQVEQSVADDLWHALHPHAGADETEITDFLLHEGIGEATNAFIIDEALCTRCGNCETACEATHGGIGRVSREKGTRKVELLLPLACRHCETPHCMSDCPPDAISRAATGEVLINQNTCIGCERCVENCPYGVITMAALVAEAEQRIERDERDQIDREEDELDRQEDADETISQDDQRAAQEIVRGEKKEKKKKAVKCDLCVDMGGRPACVSACPTGAAVRVNPETYLRWLRAGREAV